MKGKNVLKHPDRSLIEELLRDGQTPDYVSNMLKKKHKYRPWHLSAVTLTAFRNNYMDLSKEDLKNKMSEVRADKNTKELNALGTFKASSEFIEARKKVTEEAINVVDNFKAIQEKLMERLNLIDEKTKDDDGNLIYKPRNEEIIQGYLIRLESLNNSFAKWSADLKKAEAGPGGTEISITMSEIGKYAEVFKNIMQKILMRLDPGMINEFLLIYNEEISEISGEENLGGLSISINNSNNVNISTSPEVSKEENVNIETKEQPEQNIIETESEDINPSE